MYYVVPLTVPPNTDKNSPVKETIIIEPGIIHNVEIFFKEGCKGLVYCRVFRELLQMWPTNLGSYFADDNYHIKILENLEVLEKPFNFIFEGYSEDDTYSHIIELRLGVVKDTRIKQLEFVKEVFHVPRTVREEVEPIRELEQPAYYFLTSIPDNGKIYVDGVFIYDLTPQDRVTDITAGEHRFEIKRPGYKVWREDRKLMPGEMYYREIFLETEEVPVINEESRRIE